MGLRVDYPGPHWAGSGPDGTPYVRGTQIASKEADEEDLTKLRAKKSSGDSEGDFENNNGEVCVLLQATEKSVRGFLALVRREAEAGWSVYSSNALHEHS